MDQQAFTIYFRGELEQVLTGVVSLLQGAPRGRGPKRELLTKDLFEAIGVEKESEPTAVATMAIISTASETAAWNTYVHFSQSDDPETHSD